MASRSDVSVDAILRQAEMLSPDERWQLMERLGAMDEEGHRPPPGSDISAEQWIATIRRRAEEMRNSKAKSVSLDEAVEEAKRRIR